MNQAQQGQPPQAHTRSDDPRSTRRDTAEEEGEEAAVCSQDLDDTGGHGGQARGGSGGSPVEATELPDCCPRPVFSIPVSSGTCFPKRSPDPRRALTEDGVWGAARDWLSASLTF